MSRRRDIPAAPLIRVIILVMLLTACQPGRGPDVADLADKEPPPPPQTLSRFNVPIDYDFTPVMATVERVVPKTFGSLTNVLQVPGDPRRHYAFEATRGPFTAFAVGSQMHLRTTLSYAARGFIKPRLGPTIQAGCGNDKQRPRIIVEVVTPLTLDSTWHLRSKARLLKVERASTTRDDECKVSILRLDVTDKVLDAARKALTEQLPQIDRRIAAISLAGHAAGWWAALNQPIRLRDDVWLRLQPARLRLGKITGTRRLLTIQAGVDAYPKIIVGPEPAAVSSPLPRLAGMAGADGFNIVIDGNIDYATISRTLTEMLKGRTIGAKGHTVAIESLAASGRTRGRIALALNFTGDSKGTMMLVGTPAYDAKLGLILVPDLDYDLDTDNNMVDVVAWAKSDDLRALLRDKARIPVAPVLDQGKQLLTAGLNRTIGTSLTLTAAVDSVAVHGLFVRRPGIFVRAGAMGTAKVAVLQKKASTKR